jgi:hypothetical protein
MSRFEFEAKNQELKRMATGSNYINILPWEQHVRELNFDELKFERMRLPPSRPRRPSHYSSSRTVVGSSTFASSPSTPAPLRATRSGPTTHDAPKGMDRFGLYQPPPPSRGVATALTPSPSRSRRTSSTRASSRPSSSPPRRASPYPHPSSATCPGPGTIRTSSPPY